jgi:hypothetical protein
MSITFETGIDLVGTFKYTRGFFRRSFRVALLAWNAADLADFLAFLSTTLAALSSFLNTTCKRSSSFLVVLITIMYCLLSFFCLIAALFLAKSSLVRRIFTSNHNLAPFNSS